VREREYRERERESAGEGGEYRREMYGGERRVGEI
jgi:hypothetical protein